jgi:hypothetical protein
LPPPVSALAELPTLAVDRPPQRNKSLKSTFPRVARWILRAELPPTFRVPVVIWERNGSEMPDFFANWFSEILGVCFSHHRSSGCFTLIPIRQ